jgi:uncharacterized repeat protein (TIGR01451 family)
MPSLSPRNTSIDRYLLSVRTSLYHLRPAFILTLTVAVFWTFQGTGVGTSGAGGSNRPLQGESPSTYANPSGQKSSAKDTQISYNMAGDFQIVYTGPEELARSLRQRSARPSALASGDFDQDGIADLIAGYADSDGGVICFMRGNANAVFPASRREEPTNFTDTPFLSTASLFALPEAPDFIGFGDFDGDHHLDIVTAARGGSSLLLLPGDGQGSFGSVRRIELSGKVTAIVRGNPDRGRGLTYLAVAVAAPDGSKLLIFNSQGRALNDTPEVFPLPAEATALVEGRLDEDDAADLIVAAGHELLIVPGQDLERSPETVAPAFSDRRSFPFAIVSIAIGEFASGRGAGIALLSTDGTIQLLSRAETNQESGGRVKRISEWNSEIFSQGQWPETKSLLRARVSGRSTDDLVLIDPAKNQLRVIAHDAPIQFQAAGVNKGISSFLDTEGEPIAVLPMRLNRDALGDFVILKRGHSAPSLVTTLAAMTFVVTNTSDSGAGSLRQAIIDANANLGADTINFNIPGAGPHVINLLSALPQVTEAVTIDATTQPGFSGVPVIELNGSGAGAGTNGLTIAAASSTVRGLAIYSFNGSGIVLSGNGNLVEGNLIGTNGAGEIRGNSSHGVLITSSAIGNVIGGTFSGAGNTIFFNGGDGVFVQSGTRNAIRRNLIFSNGGLGIDLAPDGVAPNDACDADTGANNLQNNPVLTSATSSGGNTIIEGTLNSAPNTTLTLEFFSSVVCNAAPPNDFGEGQGNLVSPSTIAVTTNASCTASFTVTIPQTVPAGQFITATATDPLGNTSEFSKCVQVAALTAGQAADLGVLISISPNPVQSGSQITKTIFVNNAGPGTATSVTLTDILPANTTFLSCNSTGGGVCGGSGNNRTITFASITPGSTATITIVATVNCAAVGGSVISNTAAVFSSSTPDPNPSNNLATATTFVINPAPRITCPTNIVQTNDPGLCTALVNFPSPIVTDNCPGTAVACSPPSGSNFTIGTTTVTCVATDAGGETASCSFTVAVSDVERLTIACPANVVVTAVPGQCTPAVNYPAPTVLDNCPGDNVSCSPPSGTTFPIGTTTVTCTATDARGIQATCAFTVTVNGFPQATVRLEGGTSPLEFGPISARGKSRKERKRPSRNFTIENTGCVPLVLTLDSILRTGNNVERGRISDPDDRKFFAVNLVDAGGVETRIDIFMDVTIGPGQRRTFRVLFDPVIPAVAGETRGLSADQVLPDEVTSRITFTQNGGPPIVVDLLGLVERQVRLINPGRPRRDPLVTFERAGDEFVIEYSIYDPNLDVSRATYQPFDSRGRPAGRELSVDLRPLIQQSGFVTGQSFTIVQRLTGADDNPGITGVRVTVFDGDSSDSVGSTAAAPAARALVTQRLRLTTFLPALRLSTPSSDKP